jgi:hypothetical protein
LGTDVYLPRENFGIGRNKEDIVVGETFSYNFLAKVKHGKQGSLFAG